MIHVERSALLPHTPEQLLSLVQGVEHYPKFVPGCVGASVGLVAGARTEASLQFRLAGITEQFHTENTLRHTPELGHALEMRLLRGPFKSLSGEWVIQPLGAVGSKVSLRVSVDFAGWSIGRLLAPQLERSVASVMQAFTQRAAQLYV